MTPVTVLSFLLIPLLALLLAAALTPLSMRLAWALNTARPPTRPRDIHRHPIPRMAGLAMGVAFLAAALLSRIMPVPFTDPNEPIRFYGLLLGAIVTLLFGILDERVELPAWPQFAMQFLVAAIAIYHLIIIANFGNPFTNSLVRPWEDPLPWWIVVPLTLFWFLGTMNTVNWLDGLDGLATGVAAIASAVFAAHMIREEQYSVALLALALLGATLGVLPYNFNPARTFIGSSGSFFLGYTLAALAIMAGAKVATMLLVLGLPILDVAWVIADRVRHGHSPLRGDRRHLHHRLFDLGLS
ncbi:MAG: undecaprenyl/decaprenyl-phosphate alpha-N-acetylglucosaminyl 1-phosphate transferase, partial [Chloroflexota bacterium]|nr:undecaprenyl/decaprenyl-phosphate alpha-N-acetylglucosaminyl 1-phosphate transferase [Chloroflexota bacterium]